MNTIRLTREMNITVACEQGLTEAEAILRAERLVTAITLDDQGIDGVKARLAQWEKHHMHWHVIVVIHYSVTTVRPGG